ncbi:DUF2470 domain-containing protein [Nocardioides sp.]|uniref:DUF2470 domain-containing protein n=1 Tax=Nocardioides sp. TaxID=35761 RepID=UPI002BA2CFBD|nr:DUF2470 domain-containing protein [Nocardioides sp.]HSX65995.1 DUF2470 domain-containing protein [Nocardioides sp.]
MTVATSDALRAARRVRDVLARASSAHVTWLDDPDLPDGRVAGLELVVPAHGRCRHTQPAMVEIADPAPLPVRDRIRARVRVHGHAAFAADESGLLQVRPLAVELEVNGESGPVDLALLAEATADPFALVEAPMLAHLASGHPAELGAIRRLLPTHLHRARVTPLALDGEGLTLRAETAAGHDDVRVAFASPATDQVELLARLQELVRRSREPQLSALFRSGAAAARLCTPDL